MRHARQALGRRARREDDRLGLERPRAAVRRLHAHGARRRERAPPGHEGDLVLPEQELDALGHPLGHLAAPRVGDPVVGAEVVHGHAELRRPLEELEDLRVPEERLRRDAAPVQADARRAGRPRRRPPAARAGRPGSPRRSRPGPSRRRRRRSARSSGQTRSASGASSAALRSARKRAPIAPSMTRWSPTGSRACACRPPAGRRPRPACRRSPPRRGSRPPAD